jgi:hypothetical protein
MFARILGMREIAAEKRAQRMGTRTGSAFSLKTNSPCAGTPDQSRGRETAHPQTDIDALEEPHCQAESQRRIERTATEIAACAATLLHNAKEIAFVDPYFTPQDQRFKHPLQAFLQIVAHRTFCTNNSWYLS